ncbi:MAG: DUF1614 domain-containing protein [Desulfurococcaceae archaeon TW002]
MTFLLFRELFLLLGLGTEYVTYLSTILTLLLCYGDRIRFFLISKSISSDLLKVIDLSNDNLRVLQKIRLKTTQKLRIYVSLSGLIFPVFLALVLGAYAVYRLPQHLTTYFLTFFFLTIVYNRFSVMVFEKGILVSLVSSVAATVTLVLAVGMHYSIDSNTLFMLTYSASTLATLVGVDLLNLRYVSFFKTKSIIVGGYGVKDAIFLIPALSSIMTKTVYSFFTLFSYT